VGVFSIVAPLLVKQSRQFVERVPSIIEQVSEKLEELSNSSSSWFRGIRRGGRTNTTELPKQPLTNAAPDELSTTNAVTGLATNLLPLLPGNIKEQTLQSAHKWLTEELPGIGEWLFGKIGTGLGILISLILVPVYAFYILVEKYEIERNWTDYLPVADSRFKTELVFNLRSLKNYLVAFFRGQILVALCEGVLYTIGFLLIGLPYGLLLGASAAILTIVPFLGATILCIISFIVAVVQCGDWLHPVLVLVVVAIVQGLEALVISPKIMRGRVGLHPAIIIFAVMAGTALLGGLLGGILAIPLAAMLKVMLSRYVWKRRDDPVA
jgi:predicted PurR-regulated permease PerM